MSSVSLKTTSSEDKMSMYETMVEELVADEKSRYILDGKFEACRLHFIILNVLIFLHCLTTHKFYLMWCLHVRFNICFNLATPVVLELCVVGHHLIPWIRLPVVYYASRAKKLKKLWLPRRNIENDIFNRSHIKNLFLDPS